MRMKRKKVKLFYNIYYQLHLEYLLSHKDALSIIKRYVKKYKERAS